MHYLGFDHFLFWYYYETMQMGSTKSLHASVYFSFFLVENNRQNALLCPLCAALFSIWRFYIMSENGCDDQSLKSSDIFDTLFHHWMIYAICHLVWYMLVKSIRKEHVSYLWYANSMNLFTQKSHGNTP